MICNIIKIILFTRVLSNGNRLDPLFPLFISLNILLLMYDPIHRLCIQPILIEIINIVLYIPQHACLIYSLSGPGSGPGNLGDCAGRPNARTNNKFYNEVLSHYVLLLYRWILFPICCDNNKLILYSTSCKYVGTYI